MLINRLAHRSTVALLKDVQHDVCNVDATHTSTCGAATWHLWSRALCALSACTSCAIAHCANMWVEFVCVWEHEKMPDALQGTHTHNSDHIFSLGRRGTFNCGVVPSIFLSYIYTFSVPFHYFFQFEKLNINALRARLNQHISSTWMIFSSHSLSIFVFVFIDLYVVWCGSRTRTKQAEMCDGPNWAIKSELGLEWKEGKTIHLYRLYIHAILTWNVPAAID